ncbi:SusC/RagA family TonB-linked outer membrane protein [Labilibacter sediminis]|nr:SusC/RagA family TonB-linked outer membrane protein [Labilibacter sediminis]
MKNRLRTLVMFVILFTCYLSSQAQITGKVIDSTGEGLPGVNVAEKGTSNGTITNFSGEFSLKTSNETPVLVFSFIGFELQEIQCKQGDVLNISLKEDVTLLTEVVAVGYGTQIKREVTSAMSTIKDLGEGGGSSSIGELMKGKATGLQITTTDATPGASMRITVRGTNSINSGVEPLWVIDGITVNSNQENSNLRSSGVMDIFNPLADLNPDDIESIQVLKDAASTSIYGSRGANGVILVTTKKGASGKIRTSVNFEAGISEAVNYKTYLNGPQFLEMVDEMYVNSDLTPGTFVPGIFDYKNPKYDFYDRDYVETVDNNWLDMLLQRGHYNKTFVSASGGVGKTNYYLSFYNKNTEGVMVGDTRNDYGFTSNIKMQMNDKVDVGFVSRVTHNKYNSAQKWGGVASRTQTGYQNWGGRAGWKAINRSSLPVYPVYTPDGEYFDPLGGYNPIPASLSDNQDNTTSIYATNVSAFVNYKPLRGLLISAKGGVSYSNKSQYLYISEVIRSDGESYEGSSRGIQNTTEYFNKTFNTVISYNKRINDFKLDAMLGMETFSKEREIQMADYENLQSQQKSMGNVTAATFLRGNYYTNSDVFLSSFARLNGSYKSKYLFGMTIRYDGSSVFAPKNRWGGFGSVSAGWIISDEDFFKSAEFINLLKLRASYGSTGNASIGSFLWKDTYQTWGLYGSGPAIIPTNLGTSDLTWEKSYTFDVAIDYGMLKNRISGSLGYYRTRTDNMLLNSPIAPSLGIYSNNAGPTAMINVGGMYNKGVEFEISTVNVDNKGFQWKTSFNISTNMNEVGQLAEGIENPLQISYTPPFGYGGGVTLNSTWTGERLGRFYIAEYAGLDSEGFQTIYEIDQQKFEESGYTVTEKTGNVIRATQENVLDNRIYQDDKTGLPTFFGGLTNTFSWKGITLNIALSFSGGNYIYDQTVNQNGVVRAGRNTLNDKMYGNTFVKGVREDTEYPIQTLNNKDFDGKVMSLSHSKYLYKGDYLRLQNIGLSYSLPKKLITKTKLKEVRLYGSVSNLYVWSYFKDFDPEFVNYGDIHAVTSDRNLGQGYIQYDPFPKARTVSFGAKVSF